MSTKRVVLHHTQGPYPGLHQIAGYLDAADEIPGALVGPFEAADGTGRRVEFASLIKVTPRYVLFRETLKHRPANHMGHITGGGFDAAQK